MKYLPILLTAVLSTLGVVVWDIIAEVRDMKLAQQNTRSWTYRVEQNEKKIDVLNELHIHPTHQPVIKVKP